MPCASLRCHCAWLGGCFVKLGDAPCDTFRRRLARLVDERWNTRRQMQLLKLTVSRCESYILLVQDEH